jgi:hypothetical protein
MKRSEVRAMISYTLLPTGDSFVLVYKFIHSTALSFGAGRHTLWQVWLCVVACSGLPMCMAMRWL